MKKVETKKVETMTRERVISAIVEMMRDKHANIAHFGLIYSAINKRVFLYEELHVCKGTPYVFMSEELPNGDSNEYGMQKLSTIPGDVLARIYNRIKNAVVYNDGCAEFH